MLSEEKLLAIFIAPVSRFLQRIAFRTDHSRSSLIRRFDVDLLFPVPLLPVLNSFCFAFASKLHQVISKLRVLSRQSFQTRLSMYDRIIHLIINNTPLLQTHILNGKQLIANLNVEFQCM